MNNLLPREFCESQSIFQIFCWLLTGVLRGILREFLRIWRLKWQDDSEWGIEYVEYKTPGEIADDAGKDAWDIANIGAEPQRAEKIDFTRAYCEIQATYLVPPGSSLKSIEEVDQSGVRIAVSERSAYDLWLSRNIQSAELVRAKGLDASYELFVNEKLDALAGLDPN